MAKPIHKASLNLKEDSKKNILLGIDKKQKINQLDSHLIVALKLLYSPRKSK